MIFDNVLSSSSRCCEAIQMVLTGKPTNTIPTLKRPRVIKTHLPVHLLPDQVWTVKPRLIYVSRDIKDLAISLYYLYKEMNHSKATLNEFLEGFLKDQVFYSPCREHQQDYWKIKNYDNILFLKYEDLLNEVDETIEKIGNFLGKSIGADEMIKLKEHLNFESMTSIFLKNKLEKKLIFLKIGTFR